MYDGLKIKNCDKCIWHIKCGHTKVCSHYYDPMNSKMQFYCEYYESVKERVNEYQLVIDEQDS